ncbi:MAG: acyl-CoA synthetase [Pseudomonadales bacterium]|nr:acyl-CoA synthetase [Pseudomonadales bacterium]MBP9033105.1 acyl-CoA synthetase [Pseudomonadales bacterium]
MIELFRRAGAHAARTAFRTPAGDTSYAAVLQRSAAIAHALLAGREDLAQERIAFMLPAGADYAAVQWGIWRAGGIALALNAGAAAGEIEHMLLTAGIRRVVVRGEPGAALAAASAALGVICEELDSLRGAVDRALPALGPERRAMIVFTSGTTGKPKGVVSTHGVIEAQIRTLVDAWEWRADDCIPLFLPMHHVHGIINVMSCALWSGACVEPFDGFRQDAVLARVAADAYSVFMAVPTIYVKLIHALEQMEAADRDRLCTAFRRMRLMVSGSAALPANVHARWAELTGQRLLERYGMTEIGMALSNPLHGERRPGSVGLPLPGVDVKLVTDEGVEVAGEEQPGEIRVRGPGVFREYWNNPEATSQSFVDGWFRTGDVAVRERGYYRIMGRQSVDIIKSGGYKISALEIEDVLLAHPAIRECAVFGVDDPTWGEIVAVVAVLREGASLDLEALSAWCAGKLSVYKLPRRLAVVASLPRNAMGKVLKPGLRPLLAQGSG